MPEFPCHHLPSHLPHLQTFIQVSEDFVQSVPSPATSDIPRLAAVGFHDGALLCDSGSVSDTFLLGQVMLVP